MYGYPIYQGISQTQPNYNLNFNQAQNQQTQDERIWVSSQQSAEAYLISPGGFVRLWDSSQPRFYERRADASGRLLPIEIYEYKRVTTQVESLVNEANKLSFEDIDARFNALDERINALETKKGAGKNAKSNADDTSV